MSLPDAEGTLRLWLRSVPSIFELLSTRTYFAMPEQDRPQTPFSVHYRVGGPTDAHWQDYPDFIIECWGADKKKASDVAACIADACLALENGSHPVIGGVRIVGAKVNSTMPIEGTTWAKCYRLDTSFQMRLV